MRARDLTANLLSEIAEELGFVVSGYNTMTPGSGNITFMNDTDDEEDWDEAIEKTVYKILDYNKEQVFLRHPTLGQLEAVDLHKPESLDLIREWFEDEEAVFNDPYGTTTFTHTINQPPYTNTPYVTMAPVYGSGGTSISIGTSGNSLIWDDSTSGNWSITTTDPSFGSIASPTSFTLKLDDAV